MPEPKPDAGSLITLYDADPDPLPRKQTETPTISAADFPVPPKQELDLIQYDFPKK
jgi:hypothetical protein